VRGQGACCIADSSSSGRRLLGGDIFFEGFSGTV
jgi:hypothetical protein